MKHQIEMPDPLTPDSRTVVVFGGVTLEGFEKASRLVDQSRALGRSVVWFDGFTGDKPEYAPTDGVSVVDYGERERNRRLNRLERTTAKTIRGVGEVSTESSDSPVAASRLTAGADRLLARFLKRINTATRGYASWRLIRPEVIALSRQLTPVEIFYCDDHALTAAWHAAKLWPETPVTRAPKS